ncbi:hypothetical protein K461DRAFT_274474 [Myriangium duriaei CBS 260.36]|uniref:Uncharacterized protein n=1 Tax=Myriangium duriaei CBS 260.36 TaxID=1168546 RepID=A0A9P4MMA7_9PEZI|nr:hypothetical protein K461DRAFT_274474 [Myriangium duriaei CBS 260.36]
MFSKLSKLSGASILAEIALVTAYGYNESGVSPHDSLGVDSFSAGYAQWNTTVSPLTATGWVAGTLNAYTSLDQWASGVSCNFAGSAHSGIDCLTYAVQNATFVAANNSDSLSYTQYPNQATSIVITSASKTQSFNAYYVNNDAGQQPSCLLTNDNAYNKCNQGSYNLGPLQTISANPQYASDSYTFPANTAIKVTCKNACEQTAILKPNVHNLMAQLIPFMESYGLFAARYAITRPGGVVVTRCRLTIADTAKYPIDSCPDWIPAYGNNVIYDDTVPVDSLSGQPNKRDFSSRVMGRRGLTMKV